MPQWRECLKKCWTTLNLSEIRIWRWTRDHCVRSGDRAGRCFRTIQLLNELRLIDRINFDDGFARYEMGSAQDVDIKHRHHHLICIKCGKVISFQEDLLEELEAKIAATTGFCVVNHEVRLYGCCVECGGDLIEEKRE